MVNSAFLNFKKKKNCIILADRKLDVEKSIKSYLFSKKSNLNINAAAFIGEFMLMNLLVVILLIKINYSAQCTNISHKYNVKNSLSWKLLYLSTKLFSNVNENFS